jgi:hypothetical protein
MTPPVSVELLQDRTPLTTPNGTAQELLANVTRHNQPRIHNLANGQIGSGICDGDFLSWDFLLVPGQRLVHWGFSILPSLHSRAMGDF